MSYHAVSAFVCISMCLAFSGCSNLLTITLVPGLMSCSDPCARNVTSGIKTSNLPGSVIDGY